jgi:hypothetical protein
MFNTTPCVRASTLSTVTLKAVKLFIHSANPKVCEVNNKGKRKEGAY